MTEPVLWGFTPAVVTGLIVAIINLLKAWVPGLDITQEQIDSLNQAVLPIMTILAIAGAAWARGQVTPTSSPVLPPGTLVNERSDLPTSRVEPLQDG